MVDPPVINPLTGNPRRIPDWTDEKDGEMSMNPIADTTIFQLSGSGDGVTRESERITVNVVRGTMEVAMAFVYNCEEFIPVEIPDAQFSDRLRVRSVLNRSDREVIVTHGGSAPVAIPSGASVTDFNTMSVRGLWRASARLKDGRDGSTPEGCPPRISTGGLPLIPVVPPPALRLVVTIGCD
jgi:hypothetical protein